MERSKEATVFVRFRARKRKDLQLALHALACNSRCTLSVQQASCTKRDPLRDEIREVDRGLSLADTQPGSYVRLYSRRRLCARCGADARELLRILP